MTRLWEVCLAVAATALGLLALLASGVGGGGARLAAYLKRRDDAEAKAKAAANAALKNLQRDVVKANQEANDAGNTSACDAISRATR